MAIGAFVAIFHNFFINHAGLSKVTERYSRAPIVEAVIDIRCRLFGETPSRAQIEDLCRRLASKFPLVSELATIKVELALNAPELSAVRSESLSGSVALRLANATNDRILQVRGDGIAYSHLPPYTSWDQFVAEFRELWGLYVNEFPLEYISRMAVRYINRITVGQGTDIDSITTIGPRVPVGLPQQVVGYFSRLVIPAIDLGPAFRVVLNSGVEPNSGADPGAVTIDIDVFSEGLQLTSTEEPWHTLGLLRVYKNKIFESCITDKSRETFR